MKRMTNENDGFYFLRNHNVATQKLDPLKQSAKEEAEEEYAKA